MATPANRQFYSIPKSSNDFDNCCDQDVKGASSDTTQSECSSSPQQGVRFTPENGLLSYVATNVIGATKTFSGPYGLRTVTYLDYVASGRALQFIEDYIQNEVLPEYANTHTTTSITSLQTTLYRHEARDIVRNSCNASEHDSVIFVGSGTTAAVHKLIHGLHLKSTPIVFVGPFEHHSNILPWMEAGGEVIRISTDDAGGVDVAELEKYLSMLQPYGKVMIGAFSAASNVTGVMADVDAITVCLHKYGALAFWDFAAATPYNKVDMNPYIGGSDQSLVYKDAVYFSMHKFVGGVDCPGVLIVKKKILQNPVPHGCGGGTVFFVRRNHHRYLVEPEMKEEGGTPNIVGAIRAGLVMQLRDAVGTDLICSRDSAMLSRAMDVWSQCANLVILGPEPQTTQRLPIVSFLIYHPNTGLFLHHNFVTAVLNDVFGIQARGGCACAGPYAMDILGMAENVSEKMEELLAEDSRLDRVHLRRQGEYSHRETLRPGFVRINLPYFLDSEAVEFVVQAVKMLSEHTWKLLPQYLFNPETGEWRNKQFQTFKGRKWLGHVTYSQGHMSYHQPAQVVKGPLPQNYQDCLEKAMEIFHQAEKMCVKLPDHSAMFDEEARMYRWFLLPSEANLCLQNKWTEKPVQPQRLPFCPPSLLTRCGLDGVPPTTDSRPGYDDRVGRIIAGLEEEKLMAKRNEEIETSTNNNHTDKTMKDFKSHLQEVAKHAGGSLTGAPMTNVDGVVGLNGGLTLTENGDPEAKSNSVSQSPGVESVSVVGCDDCLVKSQHDEGNSKADVSVLNGDEFNVRHQKDESMLERNVDVNKRVVDSVITSEDVVNKDTNKTSSAISSNATPTNCKDGKKTKAGCHWFAPPKVIFKPAVQALEEFGMIRDGDRVLVCLSGGKDSLSLLHTLRQYRFYARKKNIRFEFGAVTVDPQTPSYDPSPLKKYLASLSVPYFYESQCIMETATNLPYECASICSFCSRMKRGRIYAAARREGYNVLALGQHLDDLAESFMMSFLHNGSLTTMKAHYTVREGDLRVIRPFVYVRETELRSFAEQNRLPIIAENCPACFEAPKERHRTKQLLASQEVLFPQVYHSMMAALKPLMARGRQSGTKNNNNNNDSDNVDGVVPPETADDDEGEEENDVLDRL